MGSACSLSRINAYRNMIVKEFWTVLPRGMGNGRIILKQVLQKYVLKNNDIPLSTVFRPQNLFP
jgi:hypothetical protein